MKKILLPVVSLFCVLFAMLTWYSAQHGLIFHNQSSQQVAVQQLRDQTKERNAKASRMVQRINASTENYIRYGMSIEASRIDRMGIRGKDKQRLLDEKSKSLHKGVYYETSFLSTP